MPETNVPMTEREFGERIQRARKARGLAQRELAELVSIERAAIAKIECGIRRTSLTDAVELSRALGVSLDDLTSDKPVSIKVTV